MSLLQSHAQDVKVEFITPSIVHIVKGQPTKSLVVTAKPENVQCSTSNGQWKSSELTVKKDPRGNLTFLTARGKVLLKARGKVLSIIDEGPGMKEGDAEWGHGMGLIITRDLLGKMGASMQIKNRPGSGLEITIEL